jgi:hypothetical protein
MLDNRDHLLTADILRPCCTLSLSHMHCMHHRIAHHVHLAQFTESTALEPL